MEKFTTLTSVAAPLPDSQVDTDVIFPARFLLLLEKSGLGKHLFHERRAAGGFVLDTPPWTSARILVAGAGFGGGSSREQAVWALADFGIRCVIAPSFGEIFFANCFKNGVLPVVVNARDHARVMAEAEAAHLMTVDLQRQTLILTDGEIPFEVEPYRKLALLEGLDEVGQILKNDAEAIARFEVGHRAANPWLFLQPEKMAYFDDVRKAPEDE